MEFGAGPELAAQCPHVDVPDGWRAWREDSDGPVPDALLKRAQALADDQSIPLGATESYPLAGVTSLIRVEPHAWGRDAAGKLVQGCFRAAVVFLPSGTPGVAASADKDAKLNRTVTVLTAVSLVVGIGATLVTWGRS